MTGTDDNEGLTNTSDEELHRELSGNSLFELIRPEIAEVFSWCARMMVSPLLILLSS